MRRVALIVLNYNGAQAVRECLESILLLEKKGIDLEVIVVDNASTDKSVEQIKKFADSGVKLIESKVNLGFAAGNNLGIRHALANDADWIFLLNNDTELAKKALVRLIEAGKKKPGIGLLGPKIYFASGYEFHQDRYSKDQRGRVIWYAGGKIDWPNLIASHLGVDEADLGQHDQIRETEFVSGCAMMVKRKVFEKVGLFDESYFLYYEDADFCRRAKEAGFKILFIPESKVWHKNLGTGRQGTELQDYYLSRNRLLFGWHWAPLRTKLALIKESGFLLFKGRPWQKKGIADFYLRKFGRGSWQK